MANLYEHAILKKVSFESIFVIVESMQLFFSVMLTFALGCRAFTRATTTTRPFLSRMLSMSGGSDSSEEMKPFYTLGVNIAKQVD